MNARKWMIYGRTGYTGRLLVEEARRPGLTPVLAGRRADAVRRVAEAAGLEWRAFGVHDADAALADVDVLLAAAGPGDRCSTPACARLATTRTAICGRSMPNRT